MKIFTLGRANARIEELEGRVKELETQLSDRDTNLTETIAALAESEKAVQELGANAEALTADLSKVNAQVKVLEKEKLDISASVDALASQKAAQITAAQGQPPLSVATSEQPAKKANHRGELHGLDLAIAAHAESYKTQQR